MDSATAAVTIVSIVVSQACALFSLWLRLRWRVRHEQALRQYLASTVETVATGGRLKVDEQRDGGRRLRVELTCGPDRTQEGDR
ncbi:hypothetical protein [Streptomyces adonidis]|uniref:hypothetical protein n=1 Tax=Streptomyces adonidis TaxID=3231367 RepID=UPI0034DAE44B